MLEKSKAMFADLRRVKAKRVATLALTAVIATSSLFSGSGRAEEINFENDTTPLPSSPGIEQMLETEVPSIESTSNLIIEEENEKVSLSYFHLFLEPSKLNYYEELENTYVTDIDSLKKYDGEVFIQLGLNDFDLKEMEYYKYLTNATTTNVELLLYDTVGIKQLNLFQNDNVDNLYVYISNYSELNKDILITTLNEVQERFNSYITFNLVASTVEEINEYTKIAEQTENDVAFDITITDKVNLNDIKLNSNISNFKLDFALTENINLTKDDFSFMKNIPNAYIELVIDTATINIDIEEIKSISNNIDVVTYNSNDYIMSEYRSVSIDNIEFDINDFEDYMEDEYYYHISERELRSYTGPVYLSSENLPYIVQGDYMQYFENARIELDVNLSEASTVENLRYLSDIPRIDKVFINIPSLGRYTEDELLTIIERINKDYDTTVVYHPSFYEVNQINKNNSILERSESTKDISVQYDIFMSKSIDLTDVKLSENTTRVDIFMSGINKFGESLYRMINDNPNIKFVFTTYDNQFNLDLNRLGDNVVFKNGLDNIDFKKFTDGNLYIIDTYEIGIDHTKLAEYELINGEVVTTASALKDYTGSVVLDLWYTGIDTNDYNCIREMDNAEEINVIIKIAEEDDYKVSEDLKYLSELHQLDNINIVVYEYNQFKASELSEFVNQVKEYGNVSVQYESSVWKVDKVKEENEKINALDVPVTYNIKINETFDFSNVVLSDNITTINISFDTNKDFKLPDNYFDFLKTARDKTINLQLNEYYMDYNIANLDKYNLTNLNLKFETFYKFDMDFEEILKLKNINSIEFLSDGVTDISVYLNNAQIDKLINQGTKIYCNGKDDLTLARETNDKLASIIDEFGFSEQTPEIEKYNAILAYILQNYCYDPDIANLHETTPGFWELVAEKYVDGDLATIFNHNGEIICGNYSAIFESLANRVGIDSMIVNDNQHSWNIVKLGDNYYHVDSCWLDDNNDLYTIELLQQNDLENLENLDWYRREIHANINNEIDYIHQVSDMPIEIDIDFVEMESHYEGDEYALPAKCRDITNNMYKIKIDNTTYIIPAAVLIGLLVGMGASKKINEYIKDNKNTRNKTL